MNSIRCHLSPLRAITQAVCFAMLLDAGLIGQAHRAEGSFARHRHRHMSDAAIEMAISEFAGNDRRYANGRRDAVAFRASGLGRVLARVRQLQRTTPRRLRFYSTYGATAFVLAYAGVEYRANVQRIVRPVTLWDRSDPQWRSFVRNGAAEFEDGPAWLARLYTRHRDPALLRTLFTWHLDGAPAEALPDARYQVLVFDPLGVLRVLRSSPKMTANALDTLPEGIDASPGGYPELRRRIRAALQRADPPLRRFGRRFLRRLHAQMQKAS